MTLHQQHLDLAKAISKMIWNNPKAKHHPDYLEVKLAMLERVDTKLPENIWYFINQFDVRGVLKLWHLAKSTYTTPRKSPINKSGKPKIIGKELAEFIETEYFAKLEKELKVKVL